MTRTLTTRLLTLYQAEPALASAADLDMLGRQPLSPDQRIALAELWRHPLHTREIGSHLTNVMRCLYLESQGYRVTVTELVGWEHSLKNELIFSSTCN